MECHTIEKDTRTAIENEDMLRRIAVAIRHAPEVYRGFHERIDTPYTVDQVIKSGISGRIRFLKQNFSSSSIMTLASALL